MTKKTYFSSVRNWVDSQFKMRISDAKSLNENTLSFVGKVLLKVHPNSPAGLLSLKSGDILYALNGGVFDSDDLEKTFQPRRFGRSHSFDFFRPKTHQKIRIKGPTFPFGTSLGQTVDSFATELRTGDPDPSDASQFWTFGETEALSTLLPAFEIFNIRLISHKGAPFYGQLPQNLPYNTEIASEEFLWPGHFAWMALCAAHAGQWDRASFVLRVVEDHFDRSGDSGMMSMFAAMAYTRSMLAEHKQYLNKAVDHMHHAIEMSPESDILYQRLSTLTNTEVTRPASPLLGARPTYNLPRIDPAKRFRQAEGHVAFRDRIEQLSPGEFILISIMSSYRTNGPYVEGFQRAQIPLANLRDTFKEVHIITSWDASRSRDLPWPIMEEKMRQSGITVSVLFDEDNALGEQLSLISAPTNLIVDHTGVVVAQGWLGDDMMLWDAL